MPVVIEVCERMMDHRRVHTHDENGRCTTEELPRFHAKIAGRREWGCGDSRDEAVGNLIGIHPEIFGITLEHLGRLSR